MPREIVEPFDITDRDTDTITNQNVGKYGWVWLYQVPLGIRLIIHPTHTFSCYLQGENGNEMPLDTLVQVSRLKASSARSGKIILKQPYQSVKEFQDIRKIAKFQITKVVKVKSKQCLKVLVFGSDTTGKGKVLTISSYFQMRVKRTRKVRTMASYSE